MGVSTQVAGDPATIRLGDQAELICEPRGTGCARISVDKGIYQQLSRGYYLVPAKGVFRRMERFANYRPQ